MQDIDGLLGAVKAQFEFESLRYHNLRKEQQQANESLRTEDALRQSISLMEEVWSELKALESQQVQDGRRRAELRVERDRLSDEVYELRLAQVDEINSSYAEQIVLTLSQGALSVRHCRMVEELLQRSNLRNQADVAKDLAERVPPSNLIDLVEASDSKGLAQILGRDLPQVTRLISHLLDSTKLYDLETLIPEDSLDITMVIRGEARPITQLSKGQMATALLPLILRDAGYPLVVDQPEDDLDNAFISDVLVQRVRQLSEKRQLIFVTHNANIPVLGDAANVVVMEMKGPRAAELCGNGHVDQRKDDIIKLLEGGKDAFKNRQIRYGSALEGK